MEDHPSRLRYHKFRLYVLFPFALLVHMAMFVNSISDAIVFSYLYLIDAALCLLWFSLAVPAFLCLFRYKASGYRWNLAFEFYMIFYLVLKGLEYSTLIHAFSPGILMLLLLLVLLHFLELLYYRRRRALFSR